MQHPLTRLQVLTKMRRYCSYRERSYKETRTKLATFQLAPDAGEAIMKCLSEEGFLNNGRFACSFVRGKFGINRWGRVRIERHLAMHGIDKAAIACAMAEIDEQTYQNVLRELLIKKKNLLGREAILPKLYQYALQKGYEGEAIQRILSELHTKDPE